MQFPEIKGINLEGKKYNLPNDLEGDLNLVVIAFKQPQQVFVDKWSHYLNPILIKYPEVRFFELPTLSRKYIPIRFFINGGMRAGIPDINVRSRTITLYIDKNQIKIPLKILNENNVYIFLINKEGQILWHCKGEVNTKKIKELETLMSNYYSLSGAVT